MDQPITVTEKHSLILRVTHWLNVLFLSLMIWSGILIAWADQTYYVIPSSIGPFQIHHRLAEGMGWHFFIMWPFVINGLFYITYQSITGGWRELVPTTETFRNLLPFIKNDLMGKKSHFSQEKFNPAQKIAYTGAILMGFFAVLTGLAIYKPVQLKYLTFFFFGYEIARLLHFAFMVGFLFFITIHIIQVIRAGWNNLRAMIAGFEINE